MYPPLLKRHKVWLQIGTYVFLVLCGQSAATLLGRLYYEKGGKSKFMAALVQSVGFPILLPLLCIMLIKNYPPGESTQPGLGLSRCLALPALYIGFGILLALDAMLYAVGLMYLPVSTFSLICSSQLGFNAIFSYFLNSQKLTPLIANSIALLTASTVLLALEPESTGAPAKGKRVTGFICTLTGTAGYAIILSLQQSAYTKVLKRQSLGIILKVIFFESMVTSGALVVGLFASREWRSLRKEMKEFEAGGKGYVATLAWQVFAVGMVSLILKVSSLFGNVISSLSVPVVPVLAVWGFKDRMSSVKVVAMVLAVWGCLSYVYQQYVDDVRERQEHEDPLQGMKNFPLWNE